VCGWAPSLVWKCLMVKNALAYYTGVEINELKKL
jgi:hypothetical protein